jgi:uncharacterized protein
VVEGNAGHEHTIEGALQDCRQQRIKIWGEARIVEDKTELMARLTPEGYRARPEQLILLTVSAWDANCPTACP